MPVAGDGGCPHPISWLTSIWAAELSSTNSIMPSTSPSRESKIPATKVSAPPIISASSLNSSIATLGTFMSIRALISCDNAVVALPAPIFPISVRTSNSIISLSGFCIIFPHAAPGGANSIADKPAF